MSDIVERLRRLYAEHGEDCRVTQGGDAAPLECKLADECERAADEITRLRERIAHLERVQEAANRLLYKWSESGFAIGPHLDAEVTALSGAMDDAVRKGEG